MYEVRPESTLQEIEEMLEQCDRDEAHDLAIAEVDLDEKKRRCSLCFMPMITALIGALTTNFIDVELFCYATLLLVMCCAKYLFPSASTKNRVLETYAQLREDLDNARISRLEGDPA